MELLNFMNHALGQKEFVIKGVVELRVKRLFSVFGILKMKNNQVQVSIVKNCSREQLMPIIQCIWWAYDSLILGPAKKRSFCNLLVDF